MKRNSELTFLIIHNVRSCLSELLTKHHDDILCTCSVTSFTSIWRLSAETYFL